MADVAKEAVQLCTVPSLVLKKWHLCKIDEFVFMSNSERSQRGARDQLLSVINDFKEWISFCHCFDNASLNVDEVGAWHFRNH